MQQRFHEPPLRPDAANKQINVWGKDTDSLVTQGSNCEEEEGSGLGFRGAHSVTACSVPLPFVCFLILKMGIIIILALYGMSETPKANVETGILSAGH